MKSRGKSAAVAEAALWIGFWFAGLSAQTLSMELTSCDLQESAIISLAPAPIDGSDTVYVGWNFPASGETRVAAYTANESGAAARWDRPIARPPHYFVLDGNELVRLAIEQEFSRTQGSSQRVTAIAAVAPRTAVARPDSPRRDSDSRHVLYVQTEDGTVLGINAVTGDTAFALSPGVGSQRAEKNKGGYGTRSPHEPGLAVTDASLDGRHRTILVASGGATSSALYALDVSDPKVFEGSGTGALLWTFRDASPSSPRGQPIIVQLRGGKWAVIVGSISESDRATVPATLYVVDLLTGTLIRKIEAEPELRSRARLSGNGLSMPAAVDEDRDGIVDVIYAGDLHGNLWKFDVSSPESSSWSVAFDGRPLFTALDANSRIQPITGRPEVRRGPMANGLMVLFGAGVDSSGPVNAAVSRTTTFYGIVDVGRPVGSRSVLRSRQIAAESPVERSKEADQRARYGTGTTDQPTSWYLDFSSTPSESTSERLASWPILVETRVVLVTQAREPERCAPRTSWVMALDALSGAGSASRQLPAFDLNGDGRFDVHDAGLSDGVDGSAATLIGLGTTNATALLTSTQPTIASSSNARAQCAHYVYIPTRSRGIERIALSCVSPPGRQTWRQLE